jgi:hypothetical protein
MKPVQVRMAPEDLILGKLTERRMRPKSLATMSQRESDAEPGPHVPSPPKLVGKAAP